MYPFLETIRIQQQCFQHYEDHQARVRRTLEYFGASEMVDLKEVFSAVGLPADNRVYKARVLYNLNGQTQVTIAPYHIRPVNTIRLVPLPAVDYAVKYADRSWIDALLQEAGTDDVLMHEEGWIKDTSYANVAFFNGAEWVTPAFPLLAGTHRARLLRHNRVLERAIHIQELPGFLEMRWINALMTWEEAVRLGQEQLQNMVEEYKI